MSALEIGHARFDLDENEFTTFDRRRERRKSLRSESDEIDAVVIVHPDLRRHQRVFSTKASQNAFG